MEAEVDNIRSIKLDKVQGQPLQAPLILNISHKFNWKLPILFLRNFGHAPKCWSGGKVGMRQELACCFSGTSCYGPKKYRMTDLIGLTVPPFLSKLLCLFVALYTYSTQSRGNLVRWCLHYADQCRDETHLHGTLAAFDLSQFFKDVLSQGRHHRVWGEERRQSKYICLLSQHVYVLLGNVIVPEWFQLICVKILQTS